MAYPTGQDQHQEIGGAMVSEAKDVLDHLAWQCNGRLKDFTNPRCTEPRRGDCFFTVRHRGRASVCHCLCHVDGMPPG